MKLDQDLVREILLAVEASDQVPMQFVKLDLDGYDARLISYHVQLLAEAGFLVATDLSSFSGYSWVPKRLTYNGHEFLETIRDPAAWQMTKAGAAKVGGAGLQLLWEIGKGYAKQLAKERLGIDLT